MATRFAQDLLDRRFPQFIAVYLGASWGMVEFCAFLEERFLLSPHWTNLVLLTALLLLPSAGIFIYYHGARGRDRWHRIEKVVIPANFVTALVIMFAAFSGKDLGAVTTTVTVEDEEGNEVERVVVKDEFRKTVALFTPLSDSTDAEWAWLGTGVLNGLMNELYQDAFVSIRPWSLFRDRVREAGYRSDAPAPRSLKRSLAEEMHIPFFVDGAVERAGDAFRLTLALNDTRRGRVLSERVHEGSDLFALIDSASLQLRRDLELPSRHLEDSPDVAVAEHTTGSMEAFRHYARGFEAWLVRNDYVAADEAMEAALEADPAYADAAFTLYQLRALTGNVTGALPAIQVAMDNRHRLPERAHYQVKGEWYAIKQDLPRSFAVYEMWAELYPEDIDALTYAAQVRLLQGDRRGSIDALETILELDPTRIDLLPQIGSHYEALGEPEEARARYERHIEAAPEDKSSLLALARLHRREGRHSRARELYERAELLDPADVGVALSLARLDRSLGHFDDALARYERTLERARTAEQRSSVLSALSAHHRERGEMVKALSERERALAESATFQPPLAIAQGQLLELGLYVDAGRAEEADALLESLGAQLQPPQDALVPLGKMALYEALNRPDDLEAAVAEGQAMLERTGMNLLEGPLVHFSGRLAEMRGDWEAAVAAYEREREIDPTDATVLADIGRCHREMGDLERAESLIRETLRIVPSHGRSHYELALVYESMGRRDDAVRHLEQALETWAPADEEFQWANLAREKLADLS